MALFKKNEIDSNKFYKTLKEKVDRVFASGEYTDRREKMNRWLKEYNGDWWSKEVNQKVDPKQSQIFANLIFAHVQTNAPLLTDNRPKWYVRAKVDYLQDYINVYQKCLEYLWDKEELDHKVYLAVKDSMIFPLGLMKVYYDPDKDDYGELCFDIVDPRTFICAPGYDDLWKVPWCGEIVRKPLSWIKEAYPKKFEEVNADKQEDALVESETWDESTLEGEVVTVYEIWMRDESVKEYMEETEEKKDKKKGEKKQRPKYPYGRIVTFTKDKVLDDRPSKFQHNKPYYVPFYDYEGVHDIWGMPEAAQIENLNRELNARLQALVWAADKHARTNYVADTNSGLDIEKVKQELSQGDNVWAANFTINDQPLKAVEMATISPVHGKIIDLVMGLDEEVSGITDVSKGMAVKKQRQTASEVSVLIESSYTRTRQRVRNLEWSIKRLTYLSISLMQQFYDEPRDFNFREDNTLNFGTISNSPNMLKQMIQPQEQQPGQQPGQPPAEDEQYKKALEYIEKHPDRIYADFEIEIQTNSTLPMDRQSLANLALRLFEMKAIDRQALFDFISLPMGKEIAERMQQMEMQVMAAKAGPQPGAEAQGIPLPMRPSPGQGAPNANAANAK